SPILRSSRKPIAVDRNCLARLAAGEAFLCGIVVELDYDPVGVAHENLPKLTTGHFAGVEPDALFLQPLLHRIETAADEGDMVDNTAIRLLRFVGRRNVDEMDYRAALAVDPGPGE